MKYIIRILLLFGSQNLIAQSSTFILIRHAEKDTSIQGSTTMAANPPLNKIGLKRAKHLKKALKQYQLDEIYSTNFDRTKSTVTPIAKKFNKEIQIYNHKKLEDFANDLLAKKGKTILIAGHSNSTPALVNFLLKTNEYKSLDESIYNKIFIITVENGVSKIEIKEY